MRIVVAGGAGFLGRSLVQYWSSRGVEVVVLSRTPTTELAGARVVGWDARSEGPWVSELDAADVIVNLCGRSVDCRYTEANRASIYASRLESTRVLGQAIGALSSPPRCWLNAAFATIYLHAEDRPQDESTGELGEGFSVDVCRRWEAELAAADVPSTRKVALRTAITLGREGGALGPLTMLARLGMGGPQGPGSQRVSWLHTRDFCRALDFLIAEEQLAGAINLSAPEALTNRQFMSELRRGVGAPFGIRQPTWALEFGAWFLRTETELVLKSRWVYPERLLNAGFQFEFSELSSALRDLLHRAA